MERLGDTPPVPPTRNQSAAPPKPAPPAKEAKLRSDRREQLEVSGRTGEAAPAVPLVEGQPEKPRANWFKSNIGEIDPAGIAQSVPRAVKKWFSEAPPPPDPNQLEIANVPQSPDLTHGSFVLNHFALGYHGEPHRVSRIQVGFNGVAEKDGQTEALSGVLFEGGDWSRVDSAYYALGATAVRSPDLTFHHGEVEMQLNGGRAVQDLQLDLASLGFSDGDQVTVFLRGFSFDTIAGYPDGFTIKGIAAQVSPGQTQNGNLSVRTTLELKGADAAFRPDPGPDFKLKGKLLYTVVGVKDGALSPYHHSYVLQDRAAAPAGKQQAAIQGQPGLNGAFVALQGFEFDIHNNKGRYIRDWSLQSRDFAYDPASGQMRFNVDGFLSNDGPVTAPLDLRFNSDFVLVQTRKPLDQQPVASGGDLGVGAAQNKPVSF